MMPKVQKVKTIKQISVEAPLEIKAEKVSVRGKCLRLSAEIADQIFDDPSADYGVVRNDQDRDNGIDPAAKREPFGFSKTLVSAYRALFRSFVPKDVSAMIMV